MTGALHLGEVGWAVSDPRCSVAVPEGIRRIVCVGED